MIPSRCRCGMHPRHGHKVAPETPEQAERREALLVRAWCGCGVYVVVPGDVGRLCPRCVLSLVPCVTA